MAREGVADLVSSLSSVLHSHAGGLELVDLDDDGDVTVRFTGMCTGCPLRPVTFTGVIKPALLQLEGVESVHAEGGRLSRHAEARLADGMASLGSTRLLAALGCPGPTSTSGGPDDDE